MWNCCCRSAPAWPGPAPRRLPPDPAKEAADEHHRHTRAEDHPLPVVQLQRRRGGEPLPGRVRHRPGAEAVALWRLAPRTQGQGTGDRVRALRPEVPGAERRAAVPLQRSGVAQRVLCRPGRAGPAVERPHRRRWPGRALRLAEGPLRPELATRAQRAGRG